MRNIQKIIPDNLYEKLKKWESTFQKKDSHKNYYEKIHKNIEKGNLSDLIQSEIKILNELINTKPSIITKNNLWDYFWDFKNIQSESEHKKTQEQKRREQEDSIKEEQIKLFQEYKFKEADNIFENSYLSKKEYEELKAKYIKEYFKKELKVEYAPDLQQSEAIGALGENILVSARAGSGKTQTISGKVAFLMNTYGVKKEEILVLCFNRSAAENMKERIENFIQKGGKFKNAKTFHSWAYSVVNPKKDSLLFDNNDQFSRKDFSDFVKKIIKNLFQKDENFKQSIYDFFREDFETLSDKLEDNILEKEDWYLYKKNKTRQTLSGINVKNREDKWISDFLFEHDIKFYYEQQLGWDKIDNKYFYHPSFTIKQNNKNYILEHWEIDEFDAKKEVPVAWTKTWNEYKDEIHQKRKLLNKAKNIVFLETSIKNINYTLKQEQQRMNFEKELKILFEKKKISCEKVPKAKLIEKAWDNTLYSRLNQLMGQFIGWMQNLEWTEEDLKIELNKNSYTEKQTKFCEIGLLVYKKYLEKLEEKIDFNILISKAIKKIKNNNFNVSEFKYILIDEFQDFSQLFQNLINSIREKNPEVNLFCVGDSWQLINGFAGSDDKFFKEFENKSNKKIISTCYRSEPQIIQNGNNFAKKYSVFNGEESKEFKTKIGVVKKINIQDVIIKNDSISKEIDNEFKEPFRKKKNNSNELFFPVNSFVNAKYLKKCFEIIKENPDKSFLILSRNKKLKRTDLYDFFVKESSYLKKLLKEQKIEKPKIEAITIHKSKGLEADIVILLDICEKIIPSIHPSNELFEIFGRTKNKILDEEKRLFYVAITRAKEKLFIITEEGNESEFLK